MKNFYIDASPEALHTYVKKVLDGTNKKLLPSPYNDWEEAHRDYLELTLTDQEFHNLYMTLPDNLTRIPEDKSALTDEERATNNIDIIFDRNVDIIFDKFGKTGKPRPRTLDNMKGRLGWKHEYDESDKIIKTPNGIPYDQWKAECDEMAKVKWEEMKERKNVTNRRLPDVPISTTDMTNDMSY